jgi:hypothetical protein
MLDYTIQFQYRIKAMNGVGYGPYSSNIVVTPDKPPQAAPVLTSTSINPSALGFSWTSLTTDAQTGGDPITYYKLECDYGDGLGFVEVTADSGTVTTTNT